MATTVDKRALFSTPVFLYQLDETAALHAELTTRLLAEAEQSPGVSRANVGGWHSSPDLTQRSELCYQSLIQTIVDRVGDAIVGLAEDMGDKPSGTLRYGVHAWATVMRDGDYTAIHDHGDAHWSCVYYVDAGDPVPDAHPESGALVLVDPRRGGRPTPGVDLFPSRFIIRPLSGTLVVFPAWLQHFVHSYRGQRPRISISANLVVTTG